MSRRSTARSAARPVALAAALTLLLTACDNGASDPEPTSATADAAQTSAPTTTGRQRNRTSW